ncbi:MAG: hypothetical protein JNK82_23525 [Myxococcaceae bacterium]|nr:hypothetical protein [Myxococcaceae bacterium]
MRTRLAVFFALSLSGRAAVGAEPEWETVIDGPPFTVKNRVREGSDVKEVWGEGDLEASPLDIQTALLDPKSFNTFMPSVHQAKEVGTAEADGSFYVYTQLSLPMLSNRDYAVRIWNDELVKPDGTGAFRQHWKAAPNKVEDADGFIRVKVNDGSWAITPVGDGSKSHVVYKFATDPGGSIPGWAKNMGNKKAVVDVLKAVEGEAQRRAAERSKKTK